MSESLIEIQILPFEGTQHEDLEALSEELALLGLQPTMLPKASIVAPSYNPQRRQYNAEILLDRVRLAPGRCVLGVTQPHVSDLLSTDALIDLLARLGAEVHLKVRVRTTA